MENKGLLIVLSGPSGVGKGTILKKFVNDPSLKLAFSISMTTRAKREGEEEGVNYYYVTKERFQEAIDNGELLEHAEFVGNCYGTPLKEVERLRNEGKNVLPSMEELEKRIRGRGTESNDVIESRLAKAKGELALKDKYEYVVCNDDVDRAATEITNIIKEHMA